MLSEVLVECLVEALVGPVDGDGLDEFADGLVGLDPLCKQGCLEGLHEEALVEIIHCGTGLLDLLDQLPVVLAAQSLPEGGACMFA